MRSSALQYIEKGGLRMIPNIVIDFLRHRRQLFSHLFKRSSSYLIVWFPPMVVPVSFAALVIFSCEKETQQRVVT